MNVDVNMEALKDYSDSSNSDDERRSSKKASHNMNYNYYSPFSSIHGPPIIIYT